MTWWKRLFGRKDPSSLAGLNYRVAYTLTSKDGKREVEVREFSDTQTFLAEREKVDGIFRERHMGQMVGPFPSPEEAERFIVATAWFRGLG